MKVEISRLTKRFGKFVALKDVDLEVRDGELLALLGPSGCGKTTLLRIIAGLEQPTSGAILLDGEDAADQDVRMRKIGFVFQHYALFRQMTVFENIAFGLRVRPRQFRPSPRQIRDKVTELLRMIKMEELADHYPHELSGGQRQRVALARALAVEPRMLLLDEPFGSLDARVRQELRRRLRRMHEELHVTTIFVTHDQEEALEVADRLVIMNEGRIMQIGTPEEIWHHPANAFVLNFRGEVNLFHCRREGDRLRIVPPASGGEPQSRVFVRPHAFELSLTPLGEDSLTCSVHHINPAGPMVKVELRSEWGELFQTVISQEKYRGLQLRVGMSVYAQPLDLQVF
ncbi:MAG: sulfate ABC transporter ATP-binding protein [candidate division KSB1 bacterium]|nr:sulfate ABC transporter ATP-binding protein [candidate division KSB1 bacterium]